MILPGKSGAYVVLKQVDLNAVSELRVQAVAPTKPIKTTGGKVELRLGSPTGTLIGESQLLEPSDKGFTPSLLSVPVKLPEGASGQLHDVYVVFVNTKPDQGTLMLVMGAEFVIK